MGAAHPSPAGIKGPRGRKTIVARMGQSSVAAISKISRIQWRYRVEGRRSQWCVNCLEKICRGQRSKSASVPKIAVQEQSAHHWQEAVVAWSEILKIHDSAEARIHRALCSRRIHQWESALRDLHRAQQLAPNDDQVRRQTESFDRLAKFLPKIRDIDKELAALPNDSSSALRSRAAFLRASDALLALDDAEAAVKSSTTSTTKIISSACFDWTRPIWRSCEIIRASIDCPWLSLTGISANDQPS